MTAHATISGFDGTLEGDWRRLLARAREASGVRGAAPYVQKEGMLTRASLVRGALVRGIVPSEETQVSEVASYMRAGRLEDLVPGRFGIVIGVGLARALAAEIGTRVTVVAPQAVVTPAGVAPRIKRFTVVGIFKADHGQFDSGLALVHMNDAALLFRMDRRISGLRLKLDDPFQAPLASRRIAEELGGTFWVVDWTQLNANWFKALKLEKAMMFIILTLIVAVAAFNIVSTLIMVVTEKRADIAILRTLGAAPRRILGIFVVQGAFIGIVGTLLGMLGGVTLASNVETLVPRLEAVLGRKILPEHIYYITEVPSELQWDDVWLITALAFALTVLATLYPASRAARTQPAQALRYE